VAELLNVDVAAARDGNRIGVSIRRGASPRERLPERSEHIVSRTRRQLAAPVLELDPPQRLRVTVAEHLARLAKLRSELPPCRPVDDAAMLLEEHVEQCIDGLRAFAGGKMVAAPKRRDLLRLRIEPIGQSLFVPNPPRKRRAPFSSYHRAAHRLPRLTTDPRWTLGTVRLAFDDQFLDVAETLVKPVDRLPQRRDGADRERRRFAHLLASRLFSGMPRSRRNLLNAEIAAREIGRASLCVKAVINRLQICVFSGIVAGTGAPLPG
jgi:hypothetical protein